jgi:hypothetical protein
VSHQHDGGWRPGKPRKHYAEAWLRSAGFVFWSAQERVKCDSVARVATLRFSPG